MELSPALGNSCGQPVVRSGNPEFTWNHPWSSRAEALSKRRRVTAGKGLGAETRISCITPLRSEQFEPEVDKLFDCWATKRLPGCGSHISANSSIKTDSSSGKGWFATMILNWHLCKNSAENTSALITSFLTAVSRLAGSAMLR